MNTSAVAVFTKVSARPRPARQRLAVLSRVVAAIAGGYALSTGASLVLALSLKNSGPREEVVLMATMPGFLVWAGAVLWAFAARTAWRAWSGLLVPVVLLALAIAGMRS